jgi:hypothetical protein
MLILMEILVFNLEHQAEAAQPLHIEFTESTYRAVRTAIFNFRCSYANIRKCAVAVRADVEKALLLNPTISSRGDENCKSHCLIAKYHNMAI